MDSKGTNNSFISSANIRADLTRGTFETCPRTRVLLGTDQHSLSEKAFLTLFDDQSQRIIQQALAALKNGERHYHVKVYRAQPEVNTPLSLQATKIDDTNPIFNFNLFDLYHLQAEPDLKSNAPLHQLLVEHTRDMVCLHDPEGRFQYISPAVKDLLGYEPKELLSCSPYELFHPEDQQKIEAEAHEVALKSSLHNRITYRIKQKDGRYTWFETFTQPVLGDNQQITALVTTSRDISKRKKLELFLDETGKMAKVGGWEYDLIKNELYWTAETYRIHEEPFGKVIPVSEAIRYYHPDHQDNLRKAFTHLTQTGEGYDLKAKLITANNNIKWVRAIGYAEWKEKQVVKVKGTVQDITKEHAIEQQLKRSEEKYRQLIETAHDVIYKTDKHGYFVFTNTMGTEVTGYTEAELLSMHYTDLIDPEYKTEVVEWYQQQFRDRQISSYKEFPIITKANNRRWIGQNVQLSFSDNQQINGLTAVARDITKRKEAWERLKATSSRLETLIENLNAGVLLEDQHQQVVLVNHHFTKLFNLEHEAEAFAGMNCQELVNMVKGHFKDPEAFEAEVKTIVETGQKKVSEELQLKDGRTFERDYVPIFHKDEYLGNLVQFRDITGRKKTEQALTAAKEEAEKASKAKADFLSTMSHEIRTPLNSVIGIAHILLQKDPKPEQLENLRALQFSGENLLALVNDILDFNKIESGQIQFENNPFNLDETLKRIKHTHNYRASEKGLALKYIKDDEVPVMVKGDKTRLSQVLTNLLSNAIKFTEEGQITLETSLLKIEDHQVYIRFLVSDTGLGIPQEKLPYIFSAFQQAASSTTRKFGGTGLGLAISRQLVERQNGEMHVESSPGKGSTFFFELPFERHLDQVDDNHKHTGQSTPLTDLAGFRALLVEDNRMNVFIAQQFLEHWSMEVGVCYTGKEALEALQTHSYDIVLMDLQMPEMNGYQAAEAIRRDKGISNPPIIALTASALYDVKTKVSNAGMDDYLTKPFNPDELRQKIATHLLSYEKGHRQG